jgi:alpha-glucosidase
MSSYAADTITIQAPGGEIKADVFVNSEGRLSYSIERLKGGQTAILKPSPLGITIDGVDLGQGVKIGSSKDEAANEQYPWRGVHPVAMNHYNGAEIILTHTASNTNYALEVRVFGDGVGYRYIVPGSGSRTISGEASAWTLPDDCRIWYENDTKNYEGLYAKATPAKIDPNQQIGFPVTIEYADGTYGAITEAGLFAYSGMSARPTGTTTLKGVFEDDSSWQETGDIRTPWRVTMTGPDLNALVNSDIVPNLCPPPDRTLFPQGMATEWIKPGRSLWNWWSDSPVEFQYQKEWVDKAAEMSFEYYLVDAGWEDWRQGNRDKWACLKELCDYARQKRVGINVWKHYSQIVQADARQEFLQNCAKAGAVGVKIDFMDSESRERINFYTSTLIEAAKLKLMVNFHGANKPTGEPRTYPNEMTREGIRGLEYNKWSALPAAHYATLPFTRFLAGHGDFTPGAMNPDRLKGTTVTLQLASAIVFTSPLMHWADHWKQYLSSNALEVTKQIPSTWDQTIVLPGSKIGEVAAFARRKGQSWFVGIINGGQAKTFPLSLSFLNDGTYKAVLARDTAGNPAEMKIERTTATKGQTLDVRMETGGGFVAWLTPR